MVLKEPDPRQGVQIVSSTDWLLQVMVTNPWQCDLPVPHTAIHTEHDEVSTTWAKPTISEGNKSQFTYKNGGFPSM